MMQDQTLYELLETYTQVGTRALEKQRSTFPFQQIFDAVDARSPQHYARVWVKGEDKPSPWQVGYNNGVLTAREHPLSAVEPVWNVEKSHLSNIHNNPDSFKDNITLLDISWLTGGHSYL